MKGRNLVILALVSLLSCEMGAPNAGSVLTGSEDPIGKSSGAEDLASRSAPFQTVYGSPEYGKSKVSEQRRAENMRMLFDFEMRLKDDGVDPDDWTRRDTATRALLSETASNEGASFIHQDLALQVLLQTPLLREPLDREKQEAIAYYLEILLENHYPDARIGSDALDRLEGFWSEDEITRAKVRLVANAGRMVKAFRARPPTAPEGVTPLRMETIDAIERAADVLKESLR